MIFLSTDDLIKAVDKIKYTRDDIKIILENFSRVLTITTLVSFTVESIAVGSHQKVFICSYSENYMFENKTEAKNDVFEKLLYIDKKIGMYRESHVVYAIIWYACFDIQNNNGLIKVCYHLYHIIKTTVCFTGFKDHFTHESGPDRDRRLYTISY